MKQYFTDREFDEFTVRFGATKAETAFARQQSQEVHRIITRALTFFCLWCVCLILLVIG